MGTTTTTERPAALRPVVEADSIGGRLRDARIRAGYKAAVDFARVAGVPLTTYHHHENGRRQLAPYYAQTYAHLLNITPSYLLFGHDHGIEDHRDLQLPEIVPEVQRMKALPIEDDALYPAYRQGDIVLHRPLEPQVPIDPSLHGQECVVQAAGLGRMVRMVLVQPDGRVTLMGYGCKPVINAVLLAASPVEWVRRGGAKAA